MKNRSRSTTDQRKVPVQLTRRNSYRDFASIHKSKSNEYLRISTANMLDGLQRIQTNRFPSETLLTSCILVAFICFILTGSMHIYDVFNDIVPATSYSSSNSIGDNSSKPIASNQLAQSNKEPRLGVPILFPSLPFPEKGGLCHSI